MRFAGPRARGVALLFGTMAILSFSTACDVTVEEAKPTVEVRRATMSTGISALPEFDAAVRAIDFDPPLHWETLINSRRSVKLLAAVENNGTRPLRDLTVEAHLSTQKDENIIQDWAKVDKLAPGETRVVEFQRMATITSLPRSSSFRIGVTVSGRHADANLSDNSREVIVRISD